MKEENDIKDSNLFYVDTSLWGFKVNVLYSYKYIKSFVLSNEDIDIDFLDTQIVLSKGIEMLLFYMY